ncbi:MAG: hypothetical protein QM490_00810 [Candidatus Gracilibacteria bacterium]
MQKRPSDNTIRISRIIFGVILIGTLYYNLIIQGDAIQSSLFWQELSTTQIEYVKYIAIALGIIPIFMGATNVCLLKKKYIRIVQIIFAIILFYISSIIVEGPSLDVDSLIAIMGFFPLIAGITGKCITTKCMRYAEKITKIRV